jgi:UDP-N-acetylmuramyl pentapeptide phosphotransferase/UDP-N-acetylglucosamine-1-phosphate transferase
VIGLLAGAAGIAVAIATARWLRDPRSWLYVIDVPNHRSLHTVPTPSSGGIAVLAGIAVAWSLTVASRGVLVEAGALGAATLLVAAISYLDDLGGVRARYRLSVHFAAAIVLLWVGRLVPTPAVLGLPAALGSAGASVVCALAVAWMVNLYNFMDGMDGFAGGMAVIGFGTLALLGARAGATTYATLALGVAVAGSGFLVYNFPPARLFLGDVGSGPLGLLAAGFGLWAVRDGIASAWGVVLIFSPFVVDATVTLLRRLGRREAVWQPHRAHYYQRLVALAGQHRRVVLGEYVLMLTCAATVVVAPGGRPGAPSGGVLVLWAAIYGLLMTGVHRLEMRRRGEPDERRLA